MSSDSADSSSDTEIAEASETRRPEPLSTNTQRPSRDSMATNESPLQASPMGKMMSSDLLNKGHGGAWPWLRTFWLRKLIANRAFCHAS
jgi:hypothetical protein